MDQIAIRWTGTRPLIVHNGRLANPIDEIGKAMKEITGKRKKSDEDIEELARLEWRGGLYYDSHIGPEDHAEGLGPVIPGNAIEACIVSGGKLSKRGADLKRGMMVLEDAIAIEYAGPRDPEKMWADGSYKDLRTVRNQANRVLRCRPIFREWALAFTLAFDTSIFNKTDVLAILEVAGRLCGLCDYRPRFGRFETKEIK